MTNKISNSNYDVYTNYQTTQDRPVNQTGVVGNNLQSSVNQNQSSALSVRSEQCLQSDFQRLKLSNAINNNSSNNTATSISQTNELIQKLNSQVEVVEMTSGLAKRISLVEAARKYDFISGTITKNISGNLRGMVINADAHQIYKLSSKLGESANIAGKALDNVTKGLTFAEELAKIQPKINDVLQSKAEPAEKGARVSAFVAQAALSTLAKIGLGTLSTGNEIMKFAKYASPVYWAAAVESYFSGNKNRIDESIEIVDQLLKGINAEVQQAVDGNNIYDVINLTFG